MSFYVYFSQFSMSFNGMDCLGGDKVCKKSDAEFSRKPGTIWNHFFIYLLILENQNKLQIFHD